MGKTKILITMLMVVICVLSIPTLSNATNEELVIVKDTTDQYIIYLKQYLNSEFEFAFSNEKTADIGTLSFIESALDSQEEDGANNIAYVDSSNIAMFEKTTYMWIKVNGEVKVSAIEIDLTDNITKAELDMVNSTSKVIPVVLEQKQVVNEENEEGTKITETIGVAKISENITDGEYQIIKRETTADTNELFALAELIEKNKFTDSYTQIKASKEFFEICAKQLNDLKEENWKAVEDFTIEQPKEAKTGEQYILYVKSGNTVDVHFLTSYREYKEEYVKEQVTTLLPHTYDNNTILIVLGIVIVAIILVVIRIVILKRKELNK